MVGQVSSKPKRGSLPSEGQDRDLGYQFGLCSIPQPHCQHPLCHKASLFTTSYSGASGKRSASFPERAKMLHISVSFEFFRFP